MAHTLGIKGTSIEVRLALWGSGGPLEYAPRTLGIMRAIGMCDSHFRDDGGHCKVHLTLSAPGLLAYCVPRSLKSDLCEKGDSHYKIRLALSKGDSH